MPGNKNVCKSTYQPVTGVCHHMLRELKCFQLPQLEQSEQENKVVMDYNPKLKTQVPGTVLM